MDVNRRQFVRVCGAGLSGSTIAAMGFSAEEALAQAREFKLARAVEARSTCTYCSVSCGLLTYSMGDSAKAKIFHIEGDPDHPVNRGTLCPKGAALLDYVNSPDRVADPMAKNSDTVDRWAPLAPPAPCGTAR